ncbi:MAG: hypothetical protein O3A00_24055, partial [Planctomycetota bacterium]|nr:hypothetical protein [Planctomycetota bacterium]
YLKPTRLQGFRLDRDEYVPIEPDKSAALECRELGLLLRLNDEGRLRIFDRKTGKQLLSDAEAGQLAHKQAAVERKRANAERRRADAVEAELERLRKQLRDL